MKMFELNRSDGVEWRRFIYLQMKNRLFSLDGNVTFFKEKSTFQISSSDENDVRLIVDEQLRFNMGLTSE